MISTQLHYSATSSQDNFFNGMGGDCVAQKINRQRRQKYILGGPVQSDNMLVRPINQIPLPKIYYKRDLEWKMPL